MTVRHRSNTPLSESDTDTGALSADGEATVDAPPPTCHSKGEHKKVKMVKVMNLQMAMQQNLLKNKVVRNNNKYCLI